MTLSVKIANAISKLFPPPLVDFWIVLFVSLVPPAEFTIQQPILSIAIGIFFMVIMPGGPPAILIKKGKVDFDISEMERRNVLYANAVFWYFVAGIIYHFCGNIVMMSIAIAYGFVTLGLLIINTKWKISAHTAGVAGPSTALIYLYGIPALILVIPIVIMIWARLKLKAHTPSQAIAGVFVSVLITLCVYFILFPV